MAVQEQEIVGFVNRLSDEEFDILRGAVRAREIRMRPSAIRKLPLEEQRRILEADAEAAAQDYDTKEWEDWQGGDIIEGYRQ